MLLLTSVCCDTARAKAGNVAVDQWISSYEQNKLYETVTRRQARTVTVALWSDTGRSVTMAEGK